MVAERNIDLGDVQLRIAESGAGQRPLLLVHGFTGAKEDFTPWLDRLAALAGMPSLLICVVTGKAQNRRKSRPIRSS